LRNKGSRKSLRVPHPSRAVRERVGIFTPYRKSNVYGSLALTSPFPSANLRPALEWGQSVRSKSSTSQAVSISSRPEEGHIYEEHRLLFVGSNITECRREFGGRAGNA